MCSLESGHRRTPEFWRQAVRLALTCGGTRQGIWEGAGCGSIDADTVAWAGSRCQRAR